MDFGTIASGSSGNCLYVGTQSTHLLVDAGISCKRIVAGLNGFGVAADKIRAVLVTHEHIDHVSGLGVLSRKYHLPVYATQATIYEILKNQNLGDLSASSFYPILPDRTFDIGDIRIRPFSVSHDAVDPVSYTFEHARTRIGVVTDLGFYDERIIDCLMDSDLLYVEANHDLHMLQAGRYPYPLKQRIAGDFGHLCNEAAGKLVNRLRGKHLRYVVLGHLSKENNYPELALETVSWEAFGGERMMQQTSISVAPRSTASALLHIQRDI